MNARSEEQPVLIAQSGPLNGSQWKLDGEMTVGRDVSCQIVVPDRQVSRYHARLTCQPQGVLLEDLASKNGTHHNGNRIAASVYLNDGDLIQIALAQEFVFISADSTMPLEAGGAAVGNGLRLEARSRRVWIGDREVVPPLSVAQFRLLQILAENDGRVVPRDHLTMDVWGEEEALGVSNQALDALIRRLRDRLVEVDPDHEYIATVRGHGLRLDNRK
jgi:hypothetical protein